VPISTSAVSVSSKYLTFIAPLRKVSIKKCVVNGHPVRQENDPQSPSTGLRDTPPASHSAVRLKLLDLGIVDCKGDPLVLKDTPIRPQTDMPEIRGRRAIEHRSNLSRKT
jgi:hypothetical protein